MQFLNKKFILTIVFAVLIMGNVFLGFLVAYNEYQLKQEAQQEQANLKTLAFTRLFIEKVLMSDTTVDFNTRLNLETMVRSLNDPQILAQWETFTNASSDQDASIQAKALLDLLVKKISF